MAFTDDKWGLADLGEAELSLTKEALTRPFSHTLCRPARAHDITSCAGSGPRWPTKAGALHPNPEKSLF